MFNAGDNAGALAEFKRTYELTANVVVLYNIGLVYAQMGRAVEATEALDRVLANPGSLSQERLTLARHTRDEQGARVAEVTVVSSVDGAAVEVDGVEVGKAPLAQALRVTSGTHVIGALAPGFSPQRKEVTIASGEKQSLRLDLVAMQGRLAHLTVKTHLPGADLFADDQRIGVTPLAASIPLDPGQHRIELRRAGYVTASASIVLGDGAAGEVTLEPEEDVAGLASRGGSLVLDIDQTQAVVTVDGRPRGVYAAPLRLAPGPHRLGIERGDFLPFERDVVLEPGRTDVVHVTLEPTPEYRAEFVSHAQTQRTWGWISAIGGALVLAGGSTLVVYDATQRADGRSTLANFDRQSQRGSGQVCDPGQEFGVLQRGCLIPRSAANSQIDGANGRDYFGWGAVALGGAALAVGVTLLVTSDNRHKYDPPNPSPEKVGAVMPVVWTARGGGLVGLAGSF